jgi:integrase
MSVNKVAIDGEDKPKKKKPVRHHGEGTIFTRSDGRIIARVVAGTLPNGKPDKLERACKTNGEAVAALKALRKEADNRKKNGRGGELFAAFVTRWLDVSRAPKIRQTTWQDYSSYCKNYIIPELGEKAIGEIQTCEIQGLIDRLTGEGKSYSLIHKVYTIISSSLATAVPDGTIMRNPADGVRQPPNPQKEKLIFTKGQTDTFAKVILESKSQFKDLANVYWEVGGRISELLGLKWTAVESNGIRIENVIIKAKGGGKDAPPKTDASNRTVYLTKECLYIINSQPKNGDYVFSTVSGKHYSYANFRKQWNRWLVKAFGEKEIPIAKTEAAAPVDTQAEKPIDPKPKKPKRKKRKEKIPLINITPHAFRHMQATRLIEAGWTLADVQTRGGWATTTMLTKIYAKHSAKERQLEMAKAAKIANGCQFGCEIKKEPSAEAEDP